MEKVTAYKTEDKTLFETERDAGEYEQKCKIERDLLDFLRSEFGICDKLEADNFAIMIFNIFEKYGYVANLSARDKDTAE